MLKKRLAIYAYIMQKRLKHQLRRLSKRHEVHVHKVSEDYDSHIVDDLPLTLNREPDPRLKIHQELVHEGNL
jgi:hypothetical protein